MPVKKKRVIRSEGTKSSETFEKVRALEAEIALVVRQLEQTLTQFDYLSRFSIFMASSGATSDALLQVAQETACHLVQGEFVWIGLMDSKTRKLPEPPALKAQIRSTLQVPVLVGQNQVAVIHAFNKIPSLSAQTTDRVVPQFTPSDQRVLAELGQSLALGLENRMLKRKVDVQLGEVVDVLSEAIAKKDRYTGGHTKRVAYYAVLIARAMGLDELHVEMVRRAAILHDVGKIGIEDKILKKNGALDGAEWAVMKTHPELGYEILSRMDGNSDAVAGARYHHERWDGQGYPAGLKGEEIPLSARIVAVADAYDAMVSHRPYRQGVDQYIAYEEILRNQGTQFDPKVVEAFVNVFRLGKLIKTSDGGISSSG
jgi:putative nucleotidyltransferase with HDIG domain